MKELNTHQIIKNSLALEYPDAFYYKPTDVGFQGRQSRFMVQRPFDIMMLWQGQFLAIEAKLLKNELSFSFDSVKEHQLENLICVDHNAGYAYIAIHIWKPREISRIFFVEINDFLHWKETVEGRIKWHELESNLHVSLSLDVTNNLINLRKSFLIGG